MAGSGFFFSGGFFFLAGLWNVPYPFMLNIGGYNIGQMKINQ